MEIVDGFVRWSCEEDRQSFMELCAPHTDAPAELHQFVAWLEGVIQAHQEDGGVRLLYATFLSAYISELPPTNLWPDGIAEGCITQRAVRDACSIAHEASRPRKIGNAGILH
ncbi:hypothetical protein BH10PSE16_BH10PSE16_04320 [soil metagenome]